uniref:ARAD1C06534p n=1 Tax=Blastobotrys adeninivorans TaxID=409370 RepID=A0A060T4X3_BLAAD
MAISSIPENESVAADQFTAARPRAYSHARSNSSSSSASASSHALPSPTNTTSSNPGYRTPFSQGMNSQSPIDDTSNDSASFTSHSSMNNQQQHQQYVQSAEAAAQAAAARSEKNGLGISTSNNGKTVAAGNRSISNVQISSARDPSKRGGSSFYHSGDSGHHNGPGVGGKLSNVAVSAAAFASKPKESALSKAKLFARQAKPHLSSSSSSSSPSSMSKRKGIDLTIQTKQLPPPRPSISERSPLARPSRELERIASIGSTNAMLNLGRDELFLDNASTAPKKQHKHHIPGFRGRKEALAGTVLSSSSSNSKLVSEQGSIYSFHPSSPGISALEMKNYGTKEDREQIADDAWALLCSKVMPLFNGDGLKVPVEDLNNLVLVHLDLMIHQGAKAKEIFEKFRGLLSVGMTAIIERHGLSKASEKGRLLAKVVDIWMQFFTSALPYLEAVFLPLELEMLGKGQILSGEDAKSFWNSSVELISSKALTTRAFILLAFRDHVIIPIVDRIKEDLTISFDEDNTVMATSARILQCTNILAALQSGDDKQLMIDSLVKTLKSSWITMPRTGKDRRGYVLTRT